MLYVFVDSKSESPNGCHYVKLTYAGEVRFGPCYFNLVVDDRSFGERIFGQCALWSPDSSIVCLQEWHTLDYTAGPLTSLLLVRPADWTYYSFQRVTKGFASPDYFVDSSLVLRHSDFYFSAGQAKVELETDLSEIDEWLPLQ